MGNISSCYTNNQSLNASTAISKASSPSLYKIAGDALKRLKESNGNI